MRLNLFLARCRVASRRGVDALIVAGRVTVNGRLAVLGDVVDAERDDVCVDGRPLGADQANVSKLRTTIVVHKPAGYLVSRRDPHHRRTVYDLLPDELHHLVPVGRLDLRSEGALLMSDDGHLVERLTHPRYGVRKVYRVLVDGEPDETSLRKLCAGVDVEGRVTSPTEVRVIEASRESDLQSSRQRATELEIVLREGRKRQVRLMCRAVGHTVIRLRRISFAGIGLAGVPKGRWRPLDDAEVASLRAQTESVHGNRH